MTDGFKSGQKTIATPALKNGKPPLLYRKELKDFMGSETKADLGREWSDEALRVKIAEACGWTNVTEHSRVTSSLIGFPPRSQSIDDWKIVPDYPNDLNAMHEAELWLSNDDYFNYRRNLKESMPRSSRNAIIDECAESATARQRAIAFVQTLSLSLRETSTSGVPPTP